jgi:hypothetical protein
MPIHELGEVIAERELVFESKDGGRRRVAVRIGKPVPDPADATRTWMCVYQIEGLERDRTLAILGASSVQALVLATHTIPGELAAFARTTGGRFVLGDEADDCSVGACHTVVECTADVFPRARHA